MFQKLDGLVRQYIKFTVGNFQHALVKENTIIWSILQSLSDIQIYCFIHIHQHYILTQQTLFDSWAIYCAFPTKIFTDFIESQRLPLISIIVVFSTIHLVIVTAIILQKLRYQQAKSLYQNAKSIELLKDLYGYSDLTDSITIKVLAVIQNSYIHYQHNFILYYVFWVLLNSNKYDELILGGIAYVVLTLNYLLCYNFYQQSITIKGTLFYHVLITRIRIIVEMLRTSLTFMSAYFIQGDQVFIQRMLIIAIYGFCLLKFFLGLLYVNKKKRYIYICSKISLLILTIVNNVQDIVIVVIVSPFVIKLFIEFSDLQIDGLVDQYLFIEKQGYDKKNNGINSSSNRSTNAVREVMLQQKQKQLPPQGSYTCYPHFLNLYSQIHLDKTLIYVINEQSNKKSYTFDQKPSKILFRVAMLFNKHSQNCENIFCFCKGYNNKQSNCLESSKQIKNLSINQDINYNQICIHSDFLNRFIRNYTKNVFDLKSKGFTVIQMIQLILYISESEECLTSILMLLDLISRISDMKLTYNDSNFISVAQELIKHQILTRFNKQVDHLQKIYIYEQFRSVQKKLLKIFNQFSSVLLMKQQFYKSFEKLQTPAEIEFQVQQLNHEFNLTNQLLDRCLQRNYTKTMILARMFFEFEIKNNYIVLEKYQQLLKVTESKFYEFPDAHYEMEDTSIEACQIKVDLNLSKSNDKLNMQLSRGWIRSYSKNTPKYFEYKPLDFAKLQNVRELLPPSTAIVHDDFVELFLLTGRPNALRTNLNLFIKTQSNQLILSEFFADFNFKMNNGELTVYVFLKKLKNFAYYNVSAQNIGVKNYIWIDSTGNVEATSNNFLRNFKLTNYAYNWMCTQQVKFFMPYFKQLQEQLDQQLYNYLLEEDNQTQQTFSRTQESLQIVFNKTFNQSELHFHEDMSKGNKKQMYIIDGVVHLKYSQLIGRTYQVYVIEIDTFVEASEISSNPLSTRQLYRTLESKDDDIPIEVDDMDQQFKNCDILTPKAQISNKYLQYDTIFEKQESHKRLDSQILFSQRVIYQPLNKQTTLSIRNQNQDIFRRQSLENEPDDQMMLQSQNYLPQERNPDNSIKVQSKSQFYNKFAKSDSRPHSLIITFLVNIIVVLSMSGFIAAMNYQLINLTNFLENQLKSFDKCDISFYGITVVNFMAQNYNETFIEDTLNQIDVLMFDQRGFLSKQQTESFDFQTNQTVIQSAFTFLFNMKYAITENYNNTLYFEQSYDPFDMIFDTLNTTLMNQWNKKQNNFQTWLSQILIIQTVMILVLFALFGFFINKFLILIQKLIECTNHVQQYAIFREMQYQGELIKKITYDKIKKLVEYDLLDQKWQFVDKHKETFNEEIFITRNNNQITSKRINIDSKKNVKVYILVPLSVASSIIFTIVSLIILIDLFSFQQTLRNQLGVYQKVISLNHYFSQAVLSNSMVFDKQTAEYSTLMNEAYDNYNYFQNDILTQESFITSQFKVELSSIIVGQNFTIQNSIQDIFKDMLQSDFLGYQYTQDQLIQIMAIFQKYQSLKYYCRDYLIHLINDNYDNILNIINYLGIAILVLQCVQTMYTQHWLKNKLQTIKQIVFLLPTVTLYKEDSYYKTLLHITQNENLLDH